MCTCRAAESKEQRAKSREQRAESKEQRAKSREQRAESKEQRAKSREHRAESRERRFSGHVSTLWRKREIKKKQSPSNDGWA
jgi:hypothetical protein